MNMNHEKNVLHTALFNVQSWGKELPHPQKVKKPFLSTCQIDIALTFSLRSSYFSVHAEIHWTADVCTTLPLSTHLDKGVGGYEGLQYLPQHFQLVIHTDRTHKWQTELPGAFFSVQLFVPQ